MRAGISLSGDALGEGKFNVALKQFPILMELEMAVSRIRILANGNEIPLSRGGYLLILGNSGKIRNLLGIGRMG